eukprot:GILJ01018451.1.p1 GENE.GILJ01018451.1~~GILJ01018451.1.p1  ORF type:complete len:676 (+),score=58.83 GILJ01018451.1:302-2029(+)
MTTRTGTVQISLSAAVQGITISSSGVLAALLAFDTASGNIHRISGLSATLVATSDTSSSNTQGNLVLYDPARTLEKSFETYADRAVLVAVNVTDVTNCFLTSPNQMLVVARIILYTENGGSAPPANGDPHTDTSGNAPKPADVAVPTYSLASIDPAAALLGLLPCGAKRYSSSIAFFRMLSIFSYEGSSTGVVIGTFVAIAIISVALLMLAAVAMTLQNKPFLSTASSYRFPAIAIAIAQPLGLGLGYASASLVGAEEVGSPDWIIGVVGCALVFLCPIIAQLLLCLMVNIRYISYEEVEYGPIPKWLAPHMLPLGRMKPETIGKTLGPIVNYRFVSPVWRMWSSLSPMLSAIIVLVMTSVDGWCEHIFYAIAVLHFTLAGIFLICRPARSTILSLWTTFQLALTGATFIIFALAAASPYDEPLASLAYTFCVLQTASTSISVALSFVRYFSDRTLAHKSVKLRGEYVAPFGSRLEDAIEDSEGRDTENIRSAVDDDDETSSPYTTALLMDEEGTGSVSNAAPSRLLVNGEESATLVAVDVSGLIPANDFDDDSDDLSAIDSKSEETDDDDYLEL